MKPIKQIKFHTTEDVNIWFTSDLHFFHKAILEFCPNRVKKYGCTESEMNTNIVADWNETVNSKDIVFLLGDISFGSHEETSQILSSLQGNLHLIVGNHDKNRLNRKEFTEHFESISDYLEISVNNQKICLFHYPILEWSSCHWGSWMLHGHLHGKQTDLQKEYKTMDVGLDSTGNTLISFDEVLKILSHKNNLKHGDSKVG